MAALTACSKNHWYERDRTCCPTCGEANGLLYPKQPGHDTKRKAPLITCSKGHEYEQTHKWCPACGELKAIPRKPPVCMLAFHRVPKDLRARFKKACFNNDTNMRDVILAYMEQYVKNES